MAVTNLSAQWRRLAKRFRRIARNDCSEADVMAAATHGGWLVHEMKAAGLLPRMELPARKSRAAARDDDSHELAALWYGLASLCDKNPSHIQWEHRGGPDDISVGSIDKSHWRIRAENYAAVCDWLADTAAASDESENSDHDPPTGLDRNSVAVLFCLLNRAPALLTLDDIVVAARVSRDTAGDALRDLIGDGLACRPKGDRKGATVTEKGRNTATQIRR